jgi:PAS domain S-box-containing protein
LAHPRPSALLRYGVAVVVTLLVFWLSNEVLWPAMGGKNTLLVFLLAVSLSAAYGGLGPGLLATALSTALAFPADLPLFPPRIELFQELLRMGLLFAVGAVICALFSALHLAREKEVRVTQRLEKELQSRRAAERALSASNQRFEKIAAAVPDILYMASAERGLEYLNAGWSDYTGLPDQVSLGTGWRVAIHPDDIARVDSAMAAAMRAGRPYEFRLRLRSRDGVFRCFLLRALPAPDVAEGSLRWFGAMTDVEDAEQARSALRASEERLQLAVDAAELGTFSFDFDGSSPPMASSRAWWIFGESAPIVQADVEWLKSRVEPDDWELLYYAFVSACDPAGPRRFRQEVRIVTAGQQRHLTIAAAVTFAADPQDVERPIRLAGTLLDITETRAAAARIEDAQAGLRLALDATRLGTWDYDIATRVFWLYPRARQIYGLDPERRNCPTGSFRELIPPTASTSRASFRTRSIPPDGRFEVAPLRLPDGRVRWVAVTGQVRFERIKGARTATRMSGTMLDITDRRRALDALSESEERFRLAADAIDGIIYDCDVQTGSAQRPNGLCRSDGARNRSRRRCSGGASRPP